MTIRTSSEVSIFNDTTNMSRADLGALSAVMAILDGLKESQTGKKGLKNLLLQMTATDKTGFSS